MNKKHHSFFVRVVVGGALFLIDGDDESEPH
jgi:hypothetical protein